jgi:hypothetical protein
MKRTKMFVVTVAVVATLSISPVLFAQQSPGSRSETRAQSGATARESSQARTDGKAEPSEIREGTKISTELQSQVDARTAKPGDQVAARVTKDVKQDGRTVIHKDDRLVGSVKEVHAGGTANEGSRMVVDFDRLVRGKSTTQLHTMLTSVVSSPSEQRIEEPTMAEPVMAPAPARMGGGSGRSSGGGLVGGVGGGVGSTVDTATSASTGLAGGVGGTVGAAAQTATRGSSTLGLTTPVRDIRVGSMGSAENQTSAGSVLSTRNGDLRLDSGTRLEFRVSNQVDSPGPKNQ